MFMILSAVVTGFVAYKLAKRWKTGRLAIVAGILGVLVGTLGTLLLANVIMVLFVGRFYDLAAVTRMPLFWAVTDVPVAAIAAALGWREALSKRTKGSATQQPMASDSTTCEVDNTKDTGD